MRLAIARRELTSPVTNPIPELVGASAAMVTVREAILRAAASPFPVVIEGESGSGKELAARAIHARGPRGARAFSAINCAALVDDLVEAELFGHARGAFTGANTDRTGLFEDANGGTLFLDETAELGARVQAKLLRVLQDGEVRRLGESQLRRVDVRVIAATNRPLAAEVEAGRFRQDLWYRLDVIRVLLPPLRARLEDVPILATHIWERLAARTNSKALLSPATIAALGNYDWPGNVRELQNVLASLLVSAPPTGLVGPSTLPNHIARVATFDQIVTLDAARRQFEERYVRAALARAGGRVVVAAKELGLTRQGLVKLMSRLRITIES
jgi:transcriptional regulator with PAS, ATPase and Fis domain